MALCRAVNHGLGGYGDAGTPLFLASAFKNIDASVGMAIEAGGHPLEEATRAVLDRASRVIQERQLRQANEDYFLDVVMRERSAPFQEKLRREREEAVQRVAAALARTWDK